jgi:hypothetical protein
MNIQQTMIIIMLTAIICVFVGLILENMDFSNYSIENISKIVVFSLVVLMWVFVVVITDLYISIKQLQSDIHTYMSDGNNSTKPSIQ